MHIFYKPRVVALAAVFLVVAAILITWQYGLPRLGIGRAFAAEVSGIKACLTRSNFVDCSRPFIQQALNKGDAKTLISAIDAENLPQNQCHYITHIIGQELYNQHGDLEKAIAQCSRLCNAACPHGVIGEAFRVYLNYDDAYELAHLDEGSLQTLGARLCAEVPDGIDITTRGMCHGVGHAIFVAYQDLDKSLSACKTIAEGIPLGDCYRGVFMEYTDTLSVRSSWQSIYAKNMYPSISDMPGLCRRSDAEEAEACFYYFPIALRQVYRNAGQSETREQSVERVKTICLATDNEAHRRACLIGYGVTLYERLLQDETAAIQTCHSFDAFEDKASCMAGMFSLVIEYGRYKSAVDFCSDLESVPLRHECYAALFEKADSVYRPIEQLEQFCPSEEAACFESAEAAKRHELNKYF